MKNVLVIMFMCYFVGCGGFFDNIGEAEVNVSDGGLSPDLSLQCRRICSGYDVFECVSVFMQALPVGRSFQSELCVDRCEEFMLIYQEMNDQLDLDCLETTAPSCQAVADCLGITNKEVQ